MGEPNVVACDPAELSKTMADVAVRSQRVANEFLEHQVGGNGTGSLDPLGLVDTFTKAMGQMRLDPMAITSAQLEFWQDALRLWHHTAGSLLGLSPEPVIRPDRGDRRFRDDAWDGNPLFSFVKQSYLLASRYVLAASEAADGLDDKTAHKIEFYTRQFVDALSPTNFVATNPEVLRAVVDTKGRNLVDGLQNMLEDLERGKGRLQVRMTDPDAFELGKNIATTPGKVVFQNDLMQLLQYEPATALVNERPLLVIPPWINKYYILDLRPENSFIKWAVEQGHTVFVISWVNPDESLSHKAFEDYLLEGPLAALDAIEQATGAAEVNAIGYCLGGTLLAVLLGYLTAHGDKRVKSATFFTSLIDFSEPGDLGVFIDEQQVSSLESQMEETWVLGRRQHGDDLQHAEGQRSHLVVRHQQLPAGQGAVCVRSTVLELGFHPDARGHAQLLPARDVHEESPDRARRGHGCRCPDRRQQDQDALLLPVHPRGPHRPVDRHLQRCAAARRPGPVRSGGLRPHCRGRQPARGQQVRSLGELAQTGHRRRARGVARELDRTRRLLVAGLGQLGGEVYGPQAQGSGTGRWRATGPGARTGKLCDDEG